MLPPRPKVSIIILQYNNSQDTIECLEAVKLLDYPNFDVIVLDNASQSGHYDNVRLYLESQGSAFTIPIQVLANSSNTGYAGGNNFGIREAFKGGAEYILILNPVSMFEKDFLTKLMRRIESNPRIGIIGPVNDEGGRKVYGGKIAWLQPRLYHSEFPMLGDYLSGDMYLSGNALLIRKAVFEKIGFFDERYFLYFEDVDFCTRVQQAGYKITLAGDVVVKHLVSTATKKLGAPLLFRYHYRNAHLFNWKFGPLWAKIVLPLWSIWIIVKQIGKLVIMPHKAKISIAILKGVFDFYLRNFGRLTR